MMVLPGSLADLVARAGGRPIYCTASPGTRRALVGMVTASFQRDLPDVKLVNALTHYRHADDRRHRWPRERDRYGAAIIVTRPEVRPNGDPFAGLTGEHVIGLGAFSEIEGLAYLGRPIGWHAVVFPAAYWLPRFAIEPFAQISTGRCAQLLPDESTEPFQPNIGSLFGSGDLETLLRDLERAARG
jgi:hypothetical protein